MASKKKNRKIVKYKKGRNINIGVIIFSLMLIYIAVNVFIYLTNEKVGIYEIVEGSTLSATNRSYTGLIIRDEKIGNAEKSGYINYYIKEGNKISPITSLYSIDESGTISQMLEQSADDESTLSDENLSSVKSEITSFVSNYNSMDFSSVYDFKFDLESTLLEYINLNALESLNESLKESGAGNVFKIYSPKVSGIVEYYTDGMENLKESKISSKTFDKDSYTKNTYLTNTLVEKDSAIYKVIKDEEWYIYIPLTSEEATFYTDTSVVNIKFIKDNMECRANFDIINNNGEIFGKLTLYKYMVRYADCRFIDIQIMNDEISGLKIPKTSLVEKEFYTVPLEFGAKGGDSNSLGFYKKVADETGNESIEFITPIIYATDENFYYLSPDEFEESTWLVKPDSTDSYALKATSPLKGVYNVNQGYCVFKKVNIIAESGNYYIIEAGTPNGTAIYDHIILDSDSVNPEQIITQ